MATLGEKAVGTKVKIPINGTLTNFIIVHKGNPNTQMYDTSCDGTWLVMENAYEKRVWNSVKSTDYENSEIHAWLNSTFYNLIDSAVRNGIKSVKIPYRKGETGTSVSYGANGLSTKVFLLSLKEYAPSESSYTSSAIPNDGDQLSYFTSDTKRAAKIGSSNSAQHTRTAYMVADPNLCIINGAGKMGTAISTYSSGIRPAFIFDSNAEYNSDGTLTVKSSAITGSVLVDGVHRILTGIGYINIGGVLRELADSQVNINSVLKSVANAEYIPGGYTEVEHIESTGTQFIDTGFKPNQNTRVVMDAYVTAKTAIQALFGARNAAKSNAFDVFAIGSSDGGGYQTDYAAESTVKNDILCSGRHTVDKNKNSFTVDGTLLHTHTASTFSCSYNLYLFTNNNGGTTMTGTFPTAAKLYSCKIYDNGTLVRDFIPCKNAVGEVGLYDLVNDKFYGNSGSGSFTAGANVT